MSAVSAALVAAFRPSGAPFAVSGAVRALVAGGTLLLLGWAIGDWDKLGVAYLGAACSVAFVIGDSYRGRLTGLLAQASGAVIGIGIGGWFVDGPTAMIGLAALAGAVSGLVGAVGPAGPAFGMMLSIGVAFGQFGGSHLAPGVQALWYLIGVLVVGLVHVADWPFRRGAVQRRAAAGVRDAAAEVCLAIGQGDARAARTRMAAASAQSRNAGWDPATEGIAYATAALYAERRRVPVEVADALHTAAEQLRAGQPQEVVTDWPPTTPGLRAMTQALTVDRQEPSPAKDRRRITLGPLVTRESMTNAIRMALCLGVATAVTLAAHDPRHSFWLPLTVAVIVRPEYASIVVRTVNRVVGTLGGALVAAAVLTLWDTGFAVAAIASVGLAFAVFTAPKLYGLNVIGVSVSAILASSIGGADIVAPAIRVLDTAVGALIAVIFGYLLWPGARRLPQQARIDDGIDAATVYLNDVLGPGAVRDAFVRHRDDAYRLAHRSKAACLAAFAEPPPVPARAREMLPLAIELEEIVDQITQLALAANGADSPPQASVDRTRRRLDKLRAAVVATATS
ncbi:FUSC family protein [Gordonia sp. NPDC003504]